jgi:hypothetical protein
MTRSVAEVAGKAVDQSLGADDCFVGFGRVVAVESGMGFASGES